MKSALLLILASASVVSVADAATVTLVSGQWIQFNFTTSTYVSAPSQQFNDMIGANTGSTSIINTNGDIVTGVTLSASGWNGANTGNAGWAGEGQLTPAGAATGNSNLVWSANQTQGFWYDNFNTYDAKMTIGGLDPSLTYNIYYYGSIHNAGGIEQSTVTVNGLSQITPERQNNWTNAGPSLVFNGISADASGKLNFSWDRGHPTDVNYNPLLNAMVIQVVPEPSTYVFAGVGAALVLGAVALRRRKSK